MGACASITARRADVTSSPTTSIENPHQCADVQSLTQLIDNSTLRADSGAEFRHACTAELQPTGFIYNKAKLVLRDLSNSPGAINPCEHASNVLQAHLEDVHFVSFISCSSRTGLAMLSSAYGQGAEALLQQVLVMEGSCWSWALVCGHPGPASHAQMSVSPDTAASDLPQDWALLHRTTGLLSFIAMPVISQDRVVGVLSLGSSSPETFEHSWWEPLLSIVCTGLVPLFCCSYSPGFCEMVVELAATSSLNSFIAVLLQKSTQLLCRTTNMLFGVRLGVLCPANHQLMLIHSKSCSSTRVRRPGSNSATAPPMCVMEGPEDDLVVSVLESRSTLLDNCLQCGAMRVVVNTALYLQSTNQPAKDIFVNEQDAVASVIVVPLRVAGRHFGGLYITHHQPMSREVASVKTKMALSRLGQLLQRLLTHHPAGHQAGVWEDMVQLKSRRRAGTGSRFSSDAGSSSSALPPGSSSAAAPGAATSNSSRSSITCSEMLSASDAFMADQTAVVAATPAADEDEPRSAGDGSSGKLTSLGHTATTSGPLSRVCTTSVVQMLQAHIQRGEDRMREKHRQQRSSYVEDLQLHKLLGRGGYGVVYAGSWKGSPAAIKIMYISQQERQLMKNAMEMAVLTTMAHPNIVRVFACLTDMKEEAVPADAGSGQALGIANLRFRPAEQEGADSLGFAICNILVMECCDMNNLKHAMRCGLLHKVMNGLLVVDMRLLLTVLLEVAHSLQHLHKLGVIHCDLKTDNVLLQSSRINPTGFTCKLGDFGLVKMLLDKHYVTNRSGSGTVTHLAPEVFKAGSKLTPAIDTFAFGIMMFELYSCQRPYAGLSREAIVIKIVRQQGRPQFPAGTPPGYQALAASCWDSDPSKRPPFTTVVEKLKELLSTVGGPFTSADSIQVPDQMMLNQ